MANDTPIIRAMADALKILRTNGSITVDDLMNNGHARRTAFRATAALVTLRLAIEESGRLVPVETHARVYENAAELQVHMNHANKLLPAFKYLAGTLTDVEINHLTLERRPPLYIEQARSHLRNGYPKLAEKYETNQKQKDEVENATDSVLAKIRELAPANGVDLREVENAVYEYHRSYHTGHKLPELEEKEGKLTIGPYTINLETQDKKSRQNKKANETKAALTKAALTKTLNSSLIRDLTKKLLELETKYRIARQQLEDDITTQLIAKLDNGEPPQGRCELCPNITIKHSQPK